MDTILKHNRTKQEKTAARLSNLRSLPALPKVVFEVSQLLNEPNISNYQLAELISKDQGLTTKILSVANSPLYGIKRRVSSIEFAIIVLGFKELQDVVTALSIVDSFEIKISKNFNPYDFWLHSMLVGSAAKGITQSMGYDFHADAFVAGILHDLGIIILHNYFPNEFSEIQHKILEEKLSTQEAELEVLGMTHQEIGGFLGEKWNLPTGLCETLKYHHSPNLANENRRMTAIIHLVDYMSKTMGIGSFGWDRDLLLDKAAIEILNFNSEADIDNLILDYEDLFKETAASFRI